MDIEISPLTILLTIIIFLTILSKITSKSKTKSLNSKLKLNLPPGPKKIPLIGNLHLFATSHPPHRTLRDLALKYGPLMYLKLGEITTVVVSSPEIAKEILKTHDITFANRPSLMATEVMCYKSTDIAFSPYGEYWRQLRKICTLELLSMKWVQSFRPIREEECSNLCKWIASKEGLSINLTERVKLTLCDITARASFGKKTEEQANFISTISGAIELAAGFHIGDLYPSVKLFRLISGMKNRVERLHQESDRILGNIVNEHKMANFVNKANKTEKHEDFVDVLLKFHDASNDLPLTNDNIKAVLIDMFSAGTDTSSTTIDWAMTEMLKNPRILKTAQDEMRRVFDNMGYVDESYFHELKYLKLVIKETLRMHPPVPLLLPRVSSEKCEISGYNIPVKTRVLVNVWAIGRDPKYWKEPESFEPERFLDNSVDYKGNNFEYIPFGAGRRICPGMSFGLANVELPLALFLYHFDWILPDGVKPEDLDMNESFGVTARRLNPLYVVPIVKKPLPVK